MSTRTLRRAMRTVTVAAALLLGGGGALLACPGCIEGAAPSLQAGFMWSGLFLMATPYLIVAVIGGGLYYAYRKSVRREVETLLREERLDGTRESRGRSLGP